MHNPKMAFLTYVLALGFILAVTFHSPSKTMLAASALPASSIADTK
jgi:hypothetical protein